MLGLIKTFAKGLLYTITFPLMVIVIAFYAIVGVFQFIILSLKSIILFFRGKTIYSELPEDIEARKILNPTESKTDDEEDEVEVRKFEGFSF